MSELSRTINPHDEDECNELNHFDKSGHDNHNHEHDDDDDDDDEKLISNDVNKRKMSHVDITFIDKDDDDNDDKDKDDKKEDDQKIGPNAMVDILA